MTETCYTLPGAPRLALLGDFHNGEGEPILASLRRRRPDLIAIAGDLVYGRPPANAPAVIEQANVLPLLEGCAALAPTFLSLGNHDHILTDRDLDLIRATGVRVLDNEWVPWRGYVLGGLTSHYVLDERAYRQCYPESLHNGVSRRERTQRPWVDFRFPDTQWLEPVPEGYTILLSHHPEYFRRLPSSIRLVLSAHAHGGQIRIFHQGLYAPGQGLLPRYTAGVHEGRFVITRGLKNTVWVPRVCNPTEMVYINVKAPD